MSPFLPKSIIDELALARQRTRRKRATWAVHVGEHVFPILDFGENGFVIDINHGPRLRGLVDIYEGPRHLYEALIVATAQDGDVMRYEFKRNTAAATTPALDFAAREDSLILLLPKA